MDVRYWEDLGNAIAGQAARDFLNDYMTENEFKAFCHSEWFATITELNPDRFIKEAKRIKAARV